MVPYSHIRVGDSNRCQTRASRENTIANRSDGIGDSDGCQLGALIKSHIANRSDGVGDGDG